MAFTLAIILGIGMGVLGLAAGYWLWRDHGSAQQRGEFDIQAANKVCVWLRETTVLLAENVEQHQSRVKSIQHRLDRLDEAGDRPLAELVFEVAGELARANEDLRDELASAKIELHNQQVQLEVHLSQSLTDTLTALPNRRALDDELRRRFAAWQRRGTRLSLIVLDVDHFKRLNDTHGHQAGDRVLRQLADVLKRTMRTMDLVARYGGEEFAVVLPETADESARTATRHALDAVNAAAFQHDGRKLAATISAGVATVIEGESLAEFVKRADSALYASKHAGRRCAHFHDGHEPLAIGEVPLADSQAASTNEADEAPSHQVDPSCELEAACDELRDQVAKVNGPGL